MLRHLYAFCFTSFSWWFTRNKFLLTVSEGLEGILGGSGSGAAWRCGGALTGGLGGGAKG